MHRQLSDLPRPLSSWESHPKKTFQYGRPGGKESRQCVLFASLELVRRLQKSTRGIQVCLLCPFPKSSISEAAWLSYLKIRKRPYFQGQDKDSDQSQDKEGASTKAFSFGEQNSHVSLQCSVIGGLLFPWPRWYPFGNIHTHLANHPVHIFLRKEQIPPDHTFLNVFLSHTWRLSSFWNCSQ